MDLTAQTSDRQFSQFSSVPVSLLIKPACGLPGDYSYATDSQALLTMLKQQTDLPTPVLDRFMSDLRCAPMARLRAVELDERVLRKIGYFVD